MEQNGEELFIYVSLPKGYSTINIYYIFTDLEYAKQYTK